MFTNVKESFQGVSQYLGAAITAPSRGQGMFMCFVVGAAVLLAGTSGAVHAAGGYTPYEIQYNDQRIMDVIGAIFTYMEGAFGALIMVAAGIGAIVASAFGQYKAALGLLAVAVGAFVLRSLVSTFFNDTGLA